MRTIIITLALVIFTSSGLAGVPIDVTKSAFVADGPETMTLRNIAIPGDPSNTSYWATFRWNEETFSWQLVNYGIDDSNTTALRLSDTGQTASFTDTFGEDSDYIGNQPSFTDNGNGTVTDNVTELTWQKSHSEALLSWEEGLDYCDELDLAGKKDWRLPGPLEAMGIFDFSRQSPAQDTSVFDNAGEQFWLSAESAQNKDEAWRMILGGSGGMDARSQAKTNSYHARCVRGEALAYGNFTDNGDLTVTDSGTRLMWERDGGVGKNWEAALAYCEQLDLAGHEDWRAPNIRELWTLFDFSLQGSSIDPAYFTDLEVGILLSSTTRQSNQVRAWAVTNQTGYYVSLDKESGSVGVDGVRCVRNIEP